MKSKGLTLTLFFMGGSGGKKYITHVISTGGIVLVGVKKRFPADTDLAKDITFLKDKKLDGDLYNYLQIQSYPIDGETIVLKSNLPVQKDIAKCLGCNDKTYREHLKYLILRGYVVEEKDRYILPKIENVYIMIDKSTSQFIFDSMKPHLLKMYIYLGQRYKYKDGYVFTQEEIAKHLGIKLAGNADARSKIKNGLLLLRNCGLVMFAQFYDGKVPKYRLISWSSEYIDNCCYIDEEKK